MTLAGTGHRKLWGSYDNANLKRMIGILEVKLQEIQPDEVISGCAIGFDTALAIAAITSGIRLTCAVPFEGQHLRWPQEAQKRYEKILDKSSNIVYVHKGGYEVWKMQARNEWMVDASDIILAYWSGAPGGTSNCIRYAEKKEKKIINIYED